MSILGKTYPLSKQKKRSIHQKTRLSQVRPSTRTRLQSSDINKENHPPTIDYEARSSNYERLYRNEKKRSTRAITNLTKSRKDLQEMKAKLDEMSMEVTAAVLSKSKALSNLESVRKSLESCQQQNRNLHKRVSRFPKRCAIASEKAANHRLTFTFALKEKGVIRDFVRDLVLDIVAEGVGIEHVNQVIKRVCSAFNIEIVGSITPRSVSRIIAEGGVAANLQICNEIKKADSLTYSGDGTTHKNINYESRHINTILEDGTHDRLLLGVHSSVDHRSQTQFNGLKDAVSKMCTLYNDSPMGRSGAISQKDFALKLTGANTDHANDQKLFVSLLQNWKKSTDREQRGEEYLLSLPAEEVLEYLHQLAQRAKADVGGETSWEQLEDNEQEQRSFPLYRQLCRKLGEQEFAKLSPEEQTEIDLFFWAGCCMHKELNTVKGGCSGMSEWWIKSGLPGPIKLLNRDNAAVAVGTSNPEAVAIAEDRSKGGAVKLTSLAGGVFNHKDDKKGQQDSYRNFFEKTLGYTLQFPDTSNTRYQSHCEAACELLLHRELYIQFLEHIKEKKESRTFNNMEHNVFIGLQDLPTLHELAVLASYCISFSHPYMHFIRSPKNSNRNILDLGDFHHQAISFLERIATNPDHIISNRATHTTATLDGQPWTRPEIFYAIIALKPKLPHLTELTKAFFEGVLRTFRRFTEEFAPGGKIDQSDANLRKRAWMPSTNDANEGALGTLRTSLRHKPNLTEQQFNARTCYKRNKTATFMQTEMTSVDRKFLRKHARELDSNQMSKKRRNALAQHDQEIVKNKLAMDQVKQAKIDQKNSAIDGIQVILDIKHLDGGNLTNSALDLQLDWHRKYNGLEIKKKDVKTKSLKLGTLKSAINHYNTSNQTQNQTKLRPNCSKTRKDLLDDEEEEEEEEAEADS